MYKHFFVIFLFAAAVTNAAAQTHTVAPIVIEHAVSPRDQIEEVIKITNTTDRVLRIFPTVHEVVLGEDGGIQSFIPSATTGTATSVTSWIEVQRGRVEIQPRETIRLPLRLVIGLDARPGQYYAFVGLPDASKRDEAEEAAMTGLVPGVMVRISIADTAKEFIQLDGFSAERFVVNASTRTVTYILENTGDLPITPSGDIIFYSVSGQEVASAPLIHDIPLTPGERKEFLVAIPENVTLGKHKALLRLNYGTSQTASLYDTVFFTVVPVPVLIGTFFVILSLSGLASFWYHRRYRHMPFHDETDDVPLYVRDGHNREAKDHDIHLKK
jgi:hypothetical protein